jgi:hypothetical protein
MIFHGALRERLLLSLAASAFVRGSYRGDTNDNNNTNSDDDDYDVTVESMPPFNNNRTRRNRSLPSSGSLGRSQPAASATVPPVAAAVLLKQLVTEVQHEPRLFASAPPSLCVPHQFTV